MFADAEATARKDTAAVAVGVDKMGFGLDTVAFDIVVRQADPTGPGRR